MNKKTVREMSKRERKRHSLSAKTFRAAVFGNIMIGLVLLIIGLGLYSMVLIKKYVSHAYDLSQYAAMSASHGADSASLSKKVMERYHNLTDEERALCGTDEYRQLFSDICESKDYNILINMLPTFSVSDEVSDVYIAMYDEETSSMVYVVDPDEENRLYPGEWEPVSRKGMMKFLNWNGENMLYDIGKPAKYGWMCTAGTPIRNQDGELCCFLLVDVTIDNVLIDMRAYALQITIALIVAIAVISRLSLVYMRKNLLAPINMISKVAEDYSRSRNAGDKEIHLFSNLNIRTGDEVENLSLIMADMERNISEYEKNLTKITAEKERYNTELALSTRIQAAMLPDKFPAFTDQNSFDIFALMKPAREVGGDFYDFYMVDDTHLCIVIADVSGKGIPAALFMMVSKIIIANNAKAGKSPATILQDTNTSLCSNNKEEMFVTVWLGILDITTGTVTAANAGHEYPIIKSPGGNYEIIKDKHGVALGIMAGVKYKEYTVELAPGSKLFVYTDGVPEAGNSDKQMFSLQRMIDILNEHKDLPPKETLNAVEQGVYAYTQDAIQFDDITMLCLEYKGNYHSFNQDKE